MSSGPNYAMQNNTTNNEALTPSSFCFLCLFPNQFRTCSENGDYYHSPTLKGIAFNYDSKASFPSIFPLVS